MKPTLTGRRGFKIKASYAKAKHFVHSIICTKSFCFLQRYNNIVLLLPVLLRGNSHYLHKYLSEKHKHRLFKAFKQNANARNFLLRTIYRWMNGCWVHNGWDTHMHDVVQYVRGNQVSTPLINTISSVLPAVECISQSLLTRRQIDCHQQWHGALAFPSHALLLAALGCTSCGCTESCVHLLRFS